MKKVLVFFSMFLLLLAFISCGGVTDPGGNGGNGDKPSTGVLFEDGTLSTDLESPYTWNSESGIVTGVEMGIGQDGANKDILVLDWSEVTTWDGYVLEATAPFDVSAFNALTFYAKADASYTVEKIGLDAGTSNEIYLADVALTTSWEKIVIPIPDPEQFSDVSVLFYLVYNVEKHSSANKMYIDDIEFELIDGLKPSVLTLKDPEISLELNGTHNIEEPTLTYTYDDGSEKTINGLSAERGGDAPSTLVQYLVCESGDNTKVGVAADGVSITLTGLEETTSDSPVSITCTLGDASDDISVTVMSPKNVGATRPPANAFDEDFNDIFYQNIEARTTGTGADEFRSGILSGIDSDGNPSRDLLFLNWSGLTSFTQATYRVNYISTYNIDLSEYYGLSFWAKANSDVVIDEIGLHIGDDSQSKEDLSIGTSWEEYTITFDGAASLADVENLFYITSDTLAGPIFFDKIRLIVEVPVPASATPIPNAFDGQLQGGRIEATVIGTGAEQFSSVLYGDQTTNDTVRLSWDELVSYKDATYKIDFISSGVMDLSSYASLSFQAKALNGDIQIDEIGLHIGDDSQSLSSVDISTNWETVTIDLDNGDNTLTSVENLFYIKLDTLGRNSVDIYDILLKDIRFNLPIPVLPGAFDGQYGSIEIGAEVIGTRPSALSAQVTEEDNVPDSAGSNTLITKDVLALDWTGISFEHAIYQIDLTSGIDLKDYDLLEFSAKVDGFNAVNATIGLNQGGTDAVSEIFEITTDWSRITIDLDHSANDLSDVTNLFDISGTGTVGTIFLTNMRFVETPEESTIPVLPGAFNGQLEAKPIEATLAGASGFSATESTESNVPDSNGHALNMPTDVLVLDWSDLTSSQEATYRIDFISSGQLELTSYGSLKFWAKAESGSVTTTAGLELGKSQYVKSVTITDAWTEYSIDFDDPSKDLSAVTNLFYITGDGTVGKIFLTSMRFVETPEESTIPVLPGAFNGQLEAKPIEATLTGAGASDLSAEVASEEVPDATGGNPTAKNVLALDWSDLTSSQEATYRIDFISSGQLELTSYGSLKFWAKAESGSVTTTAGLELGRVDSQYAKSVTITDAWTEYSIDFDDPSKVLSAVTNLFYITSSTGKIFLTSMRFVETPEESTIPVLPGAFNGQLEAKPIEATLEGDSGFSATEPTESSVPDSTGGNPTAKNVLVLDWSGTSSKEATYRIDFISSGQLELTSYGSLKFWAKAESGSVTTTAGLELGTAASQYAKSVTITDAWQEHSIDFDDPSNKDLSAVTNLFYITSSAGKIFLTNMRFVNPIPDLQVYSSSNDPEFLAGTEELTGGAFSLTYPTITNPDGANKEVIALAGPTSFSSGTYQINIPSGGTRDLSDYTKLSFKAKTESGSGSFVSAGFNFGSSNPVELTNPNQLTNGDWGLYEVTIGSTLDLSTVNNLFYITVDAAGAASTGLIYIDEIVFSQN